MAKPIKERRCGCGRPATHRLKGGVNTMFKLWTPTGEFPLRIPVNQPALCVWCARGTQAHHGGRVYRWRRVRSGGRRG